MPKRTKISSAALLALSAAAALPVLAQDGQRVEITGSNIRRAQAETASPVQVITKQEIDQSGKGTVAEYLQTLTADGQGSVPFTYGRGFSGATASGISLRGLGSNATLVLINGRRITSAVLADDAQRSFTDLNQIPMEAVERVEVLKDGASSIYGSDAVAGVVNIILRKNYTGTVLKASFGQSAYGDGEEKRAAITTGFGDLGKDGFNVLLNAEFGRKDPIYYRDRTDRGTVGVSAIGRYGFDPNAGPTNNIARAGGNGTIPVDTTKPSGRVNNASAPGFIGNVRNPTTLDYYSRSDPAGVGFAPSYTGAAAARAFCLANTNLAQTNDAGGCINDQRQAVNQVQPLQETGSLFGRFTKQINADTEAFVEIGLYRSRSRVDALAIAPSTAYFRPDGVVVSQTAATVLGAAHPDNPYFGAAARLSYNPQFDTGITGTNSKIESGRLQVGVRGTFASWDFDTAISLSKADQTDTATNVMNWQVKNALLNPTAANVAAARAVSPGYAALPANTFWRIGENAKLNSAAMYDALLDDKQRQGQSRQYGVDLKLSRELGRLEGGPIGLAMGIDLRKESNELKQWDGQGLYQGLSLTSYSGERKLAAAYGEVALPVSKQLELSAALRFDHYNTAGNSTTPKVGAKFKAADNFALRATYARGFRAPSPMETNSLAGFGGIVVDDTNRCAALRADGVAEATVASTCEGVAPTFVINGNPALKPEKSQSATLGIVWDITPKTALTADLWQIKRSGLIVQEDGQTAVDNEHLDRDPSTKISPNDPGGILVGRVLYTNANDSITRGIDLELKHRMDLGEGMGKLNVTGTWTHLIMQRVIAADGVVHDYAGTHGNCDITNCIGSPRDRISVAFTWDMGAWRLGANLNYRGRMSNTFEKSDTECAQKLLNGSDFPPGCKVASFKTIDLSGAWKIGKNTEIFGNIANAFNAKPPADFETYGAIGYNPLDYSGAIGRYFRIGLKHQF